MAVKALVFSFFCFVVLNVSFHEVSFFDVEAKTCDPYGSGSECGSNEYCVLIGDDEGVCRTKRTEEQKAKQRQRNKEMIDEMNGSSGSSSDGILGTLKGIYGVLSNPLDSILLAILTFMSGLAKIAAVLFGVVVTPSLFNRIFIENGELLYSIWTFIRDFLNIFFILILLFSAFATVFQVSKYHIQKILLWVVLMALLVNFSWPLTRIIIDFSNVTMYFLVDEMLGDFDVIGNNTTAKIGALSGLGDILVPEDFSKAVGEANLETSYLLLAIVVVFIFAMTLLAYALNLSLIHI